LSAGLAAGARPSASGILTAVAIVAGVVLRLAPVATVDFPLNDGGLFLQMIREVQGNGYALPSLSHYNGLAIPFAYPPLGFYVGALVSSMLRIDAIQVLHLVPPATAVLSLGAFALLARAAISAPAGAAVATLAFAAVPGSYVTMIMGGGLTRALGQLFAILALWAGLEFAHRARWLPWLGLVVFAAGAVLSHLEWGLFVGVGLLVLLLRRGRDPVAARGFLSSFVAIGVVTAPWWATMLARYGPGPFATASESGSWVTLLVSQRGDDSSIAFIAFAVAWGALCSVAVARGGAPWLLVGWIGLLALADFRAFGQLAAIPASVGLGCGASALAMAAEPIGARLGVRPAMRARFALERESRLSAGGQGPPVAAKRGEPDGPAIGPRTLPRAVLPALGAVLAAAWVGVVIVMNLASYSAFRGALVPLSPPERAAMAWVAAEAPAGSEFLIIPSTGWAIDRVGEWFPTLAGRRSLATVQGTEWIPGAFERTERAYAAARACGGSDAACLDTWSAAAGERFQYVYLPKSDVRPCCDALRAALREDRRYAVVYDGPGVTIFRRVSP